MTHTLTFATKLVAAQRYLNGDGSAQKIGQALGLDHHDVIIYSLRYAKFGESGLQKQPYVVATYQQKLDILREYKEKALSLNELSAQTGFSRATIKKMASHCTSPRLQSVSQHKTTW